MHFYRCITKQVSVSFLTINISNRNGLDWNQTEDYKMGTKKSLDSAHKQSEINEYELIYLFIYRQNGLTRICMTLKKKDDIR